MSTYCKYCHEIGHSAVQCKEVPTNKRTYFYCFKPGHIRAQCPDKVALGKRRKENHTSPASCELTPPVNAVAIAGMPSDTTATEAFNTEVSQHTTNVSLDETLESQIQVLQQEITSVAILKAERTWRERGKTDVRYLKKSAEQ